MWSDTFFVVQAQDWMTNIQLPDWLLCTHLIQPFISTDHHGVRDAAEGECFGHQGAYRWCIDANNASARDRRVYHWTQNVEQCLDAHLKQGGLKKFRGVGGLQRGIWCCLCMPT